MLHVSYACMFNVSDNDVVPPELQLESVCAHEPHAGDVHMDHELL